MQYVVTIRFCYAVYCTIVTQCDKVQSKIKNWRSGGCMPLYKLGNQHLSDCLGREAIKIISEASYYISIST